MKKNKLFLMLLAFFAFGQMGWAQNIVSVNYVDENGTTQNVNATSLDHIASVNPDGAIIGSSGFTNWYVVQGNDVVINGQLGFYGGINLILCDGAKLTIDKTDGDAIASLDNTDTKYTLTIYVQAGGTGQLVANASSSAIHTENLTIHGGVITATGGTHGIYAPQNNIVINGGTVTAVAQNGNAIEGYNVTINGGIVSATGNGGIQNGMTGTTTLGYTNNTDRITATSYLLGNSASTVKVKDGQYMITNNGVIIYGSLDEDKRNAIAGRILSPYTPPEWTGHGTLSEPYIIDSEDDLNLLSLRTNGGGNDYSDTYFKLGANITFSASSDWNDASNTESNFTAIGSFSGHFDGDVYTISGLRIRKDDGVGLFSYLADGAVVENITLNNSRVTGNSKIGGIVGSLQSGTTVNNCHVTNTVYVYSKYHYTGIRGGVVGYNYGGTISNCVSEATIGRTTEVWDNTNDKAGGIVGVNESGTLTGNLVIGANITCYTENYGAIAGNNESGTLSNNYYHACTVNGTANTVNIGVNGADITTSDGAMSIHTITKPNDVTITTDPTLVYGGTNYWKYGTTITLSGGLDGTPTDGWQKAYSINDVVISENSTTIKDNFDMPAEDVTIRIGEIHADWANTPNNPTAGSSSDNPYKIYFTDQLDLLATRVNNDNTNTGYAGKYFKLMNNLEYDTTVQNNYIAIGNWNHQFKGCFDGNNDTISGIRINKSGSNTSTDGYQGIFGYIQKSSNQTPSCEVKNLTIDDADITAYDYAGGIVGYLYDGTVTNCHATSTVFVRSTSTSVSRHGGIVGSATAYSYTSEISHCTSSATLTSTNANGSGYGAIAGTVTKYNNISLTVSDNLAIGATVPSAYDNKHGAIVGENDQNNSTLAHNYYHNCTVAGEVNTVTKGCQNANVTQSDGAIPVFTVSVPEGVTASATPTVTHNSVNYYKESVPITLTGGLTGETTPGCQKAYVVYGDTLIGSNLAPGHVFDMQNANAVVTVVEVPADWAAEEGAGDTEENPYKIYYTEQLDLLATRVNAGESYSGKYFKLMDNLTYDNTKQNNYTAIGNYNHQFKGCFDGNNDTISGIRINKSGSNTITDGYQGIFGHIGNGDSQVPPCKVKNLTIDDADITAYDYAGGIVGFFYGGTVTNCHATSTVFIRAVAAGANSHGGIVGEASAYNTAAEISHCTSSATLTNTSVGVTEYGAIVGAIRSGVTMSDNFAIEATVPSCANNDHGAIVGYNNGSTLARNYYHNCTVAGIANVTDKGCANANVDANDGAMPVFTLSVANDISFTATPTVTLTHNTVNYYKLGTTVTLSYSTPANPGYRHIYSVNGTPIPNYGTSFDINSNSVVTVEENQLIDFEEHQGTAADPYLIYNAEQWNQFATRVNGGNTYSGKFFKLMEDISVTTMVGSHPDANTYNSFNGTFDGDGHTITVNYTTNDEFCGPFAYTYGATIKNLITDGTINTSNKHAGGVVGRNGTGNLTMTNVKSSVTINSTYSGSAQHGGLVGYAINGTLEGCAFTGKLLGSSSHHCGGLVGWKTNTDNSSLTLTHCIFNPSQVSVGTDGSKPFVVDNGTVNCINCYYLSTALGTSQGNRARTITGGDNVVVAFAGSGNVYDVSGISGYDVGIVYDSVLYAGKSESVQVDLTYTGSIPAHTSPVYTVTNGSLSGITLTLNNSNDAAVTISYDHYETDNWSGTGTEDDPYLIYTEGQWILLADRVSNEDNPNSYSGKYFKLMEDISINYNNNDADYQNPYPKLVGYGERSFQGTFDGNGHTIVMSYKNRGFQDYPIALFPSVKNATIKRLTVDGYIYRDVSSKGIAGIVGSSYGTTNLVSCRSSVDVQNDGDHSPNEANGGGLVAYVESGTLNMINCVFDGRLVGHSNLSTYAHLWGGMINYVRDGAKANLINCLFNPEDTKLWDSGATATFARKHDDATVNLTNCYYRNNKLGSTQGTSAIGWPYEQLLDSLGYAWEYIPDLSGYVNVGGVNVWQSRPAVFQPIMQPQTFTGEGTEGSPYQIATAEDWDKLAIYVGHQDSHSSDHFQMTGDISTTSMVGLFKNLTFKGTFDGGGNTLNVNYRVTSMPDKEISTAAPFAFIENATITDLHTAGSITTAGMRPAGVAGFVVGNSSITNCKSEVALISSHNDDIDAGGFVARVNEDKSVTLTGCLFTGSITYNDPNGYEGGGIVGWTQDNATATLTDCVFAPSAIDITKFVTNDNNKKHRMFVGGKERGALIRCYYNDVAAASGMVAEGERVYSIVPGQNVTMQLYGIATDYTVSGITIYGTGDKGLKFDDVFYAASGNVLDLNLGVTVPFTVANYLANGEVITFSDTWNNYTLTMPNVDVVITANLNLTREIIGHGAGNGGWNLIASPIAADVAPTAVGNLVAETTTDFDLYRFNQSATLEWENYKQEGDHHHFDLESGRGYLYANAQSVNLIFTGIPYSGNGKVALDYAENVEFAGWNLVGNPFADTVCVKDGQGQPKPYFKMNAARNELIADTLNSSVGPMEGIFVYTTTANDTVVFTPQRSRAVNDDEGSIVIDLGHEATVIDRAIVRFDEGQTLPKFQINKNSTKIYIPQDGKDYAIASVGGDGVHTVSTEMPVNFKAEENGTYTITINTDHVEMSYLHLIDNMTGNDVDLLALRQAQGPATYTFTAKTTDYESRFRLVFSTVSEDADGDSDGTFAFFSNGNWIIANEGKATLQVIDINGRILTNETVNGSVSKAINAAPGVYMLRLINGNDVKTQKIVVR